MARYEYERLSAQDAGFLWAEQPNNALHVGALAIVDAELLKRDDGSIDIARYRAHVESVLHWIPRYRQKLEWTPIEGWPVWVDDRQFDIGYHIRHIAMPRPGTTEQLRELAARINARSLDRRHPLWEIWIIEGVAGGEQFAVLNKVHHCMIDGAAGSDLTQILLSISPKVEPSPEVPYMPRPVPTRTELLRDSIALGISRPLKLYRNAVMQSTGIGSPTGRSSSTDAPSPEFSESPDLASRVRSLKDLLQHLVSRASPSPLNGELGPHRRIDWLTMPLDDVKDLRRVLGCTVNDVVLATVTEAVRRYLFRRRVDHRKIDFRVAAPVSTRRPQHDRRQGNHVSTWVVPLPLRLQDPIEQLESIRQHTKNLKQSQASLGLETVMEVAEWLPGPLLAKGLGAITSPGPVNMIVTNVPGPQFPLYMVGAQMQALYPLVPLVPGGGLGVAIFSYDGKLCWGFNGDYELVPDLGAFVDDVRIAFEGLRAAVVSKFMDRRTAPPEEPVPEPVAATSPRPASALNGNASKGSASSRPAAPTLPVAEEGASAH